MQINFLKISIMAIALMISANTLIAQFGDSSDPFSQTITVDELINSNINAMGGAQNISNIKGVKLDMEVSARGRSGINEILIDGTGNYKMVSKMGERTDAIIINGGKGWNVATDSTVIEMAAPQVNQFVQQIEMQVQTIKSPLFGYNPNNTNAEYAGIENRKGVAYHKLEMSPKAAPTQKQFLYINPTTYFVDYLEMPSPQGKLQIVFDDYKRTSNISAPMSITSKLDGNIQNMIKLKNVKINPKFSAEEFQIPKPKEDEQK
jgi:outer membrane lipoprotein-sorting protein